MQLADLQLATRFLGKLREVAVQPSWRVAGAHPQEDLPSSCSDSPPSPDADGKTSVSVASSSSTEGSEDEEGKGTEAQNALDSLRWAHAEKGRELHVLREGSEGTPRCRGRLLNNATIGAGMHTAAAVPKPWCNTCSCTLPPEVRDGLPWPGSFVMLSRQVTCGSSCRVFAKVARQAFPSLPVRGPGRTGLRPASRHKHKCASSPLSAHMWCSAPIAVPKSFRGCVLLLWFGVLGLGFVDWLLCSLPLALPNRSESSCCSHSLHTRVVED